MKITWDTIFTFIDENQIEQVVTICQKMNKDECNTITKRLIEEMQNTNVTNHRNTIAIILGDLKCDGAIEAILTLINDANYKHCRGSLIYALQELECHNKIKQLLPLIFEGNWETKCNMCHLIEKKAGLMSDADKSECVHILDKKIEDLENDVTLLKDVRNIILDSDNGVSNKIILT